MNPSGPEFGGVDLTDCDREPIRTPGSIQPHGVLLVLHPESLRIVQVAGNTVLLDRSHRELLGETLETSLGTAALLRIQALLRDGYLQPRPSLIMEVALGGRPLDVRAHLSGGLVVIEVEPRLGVSTSDAIEMIQAMVARVQSAETMAALLDALALVVQVVTGYDRVMVYQFNGDDSGHVVAEHRRTPDVESFFDLHYPASDIPVQARELYRNSWMRMIPDVAYQPQPLNPILNPITNAPLDLSFCALRSVSPLHLEYLTNMGVESSTSLSLIIGDRLWGLIVCHHRRTLLLNTRVRAALEVFAQLASLQLRSRLDLDLSDRRIATRDLGAQLITAMSGGGLPHLLDQLPNLLDMVRAGGVAVFVDGVATTLGATPSGADLAALIEWLDLDSASGVLALDCLSDHFPPAARYLSVGAGLLALSISRSPRDYVLWFLPEMIRTVTWAGDPAKPVTKGKLGDRLTPRQSFAAWTEMVERHSRPWSEVEIESAAALRVAILDVVLRRFDQLERERAREKQHQDLLLAELDHRVKNTLATIQAVVRLSGRTAEDLVSYTRSLERRINAMAKSHSLLTAGRWQSASLRTLVDDELGAHRPRHHASVQIAGEDVQLEPKAAGAVGLVLHELATNAVKHGCLSVEDGIVQIHWSRTECDGAEWLTLDWRETCGPPVIPPTRVGFGRTLLERVFAHDVKGRLTLDFRPEGVVCMLSIPYACVVANQAGPASRPFSVVASPAAGERPLANLRVLIVEDSALVALELAETLTAFGAEHVGTCGCVSEALAIASTAAVDVALLDVDLSGEPVWPVAEMLRRRDIPFVFSTGFTDVLLRPPAFRNVVTVTKPYRAAALLEVLRSVADDRDSGRGPTPLAVSAAGPDR